MGGKMPINTLRMTIEQTDNGWVLTFTGHDLLPCSKVFTVWEDLLTELEKYFGWYDLSGKHSKKNPY
jgi:hypothetical protein